MDHYTSEKTLAPCPGRESDDPLTLVNAVSDGDLRQTRQQDDIVDLRTMIMGDKPSRRKSIEDISVPTRYGLAVTTDVTQDQRTKRYGEV